jgi:hypothetical protein
MARTGAAMQHPTMLVLKTASLSPAQGLDEAGRPVRVLVLTLTLARGAPPDQPEQDVQTVSFALQETPMEPGSLQ